MVQETQLPDVRIQPDWNVELELHSLGRELQTSSFWTSYKDTTNQSNDSVFVSSKGHLQLTPSDKSLLQVSSFDDKLKKWIVLQGPNQPFKFQSPNQLFKDLHGSKMPIHNIDLSPQGELATTCSDNGSLLVWEVSNGAVRRDLKGHVGDVLVSKFFPSGQVIISSGSDRQIKIWNLMDGVCAATLKGHTLGVTSLDFVDRGRNFITASRDGSVRLWETSTQSTVSVLYSSTNSINDCKLCVSKFDIPSERQHDHREYGTDGKLALLACENGKFVGIDLRSNKSAFEVDCGSPVNTCTPLSDSQYLVGLDNGTILQWDASNLKEASSSWTRSNIPILKLLNNGNKEAWVTTKDGQCYLLDTQNNKVVIDLVGVDIDPIEAIAVNKGLVITGSRDAIIRKYNI